MADAREGQDASRERARRRLGLVVTVAVALVFAGQLVALALGQAVVALACFALLIVAWFAFRSVVRRREREGGGAP